MSQNNFDLGIVSKGKKDLLGILYSKSRDQDNIVVPVRNMRSNVKVKLKVQRPKVNMYHKSPQLTMQQTKQKRIRWCYLIW